MNFSGFGIRNVAVPALAMVMSLSLAACATSEATKKAENVVKGDVAETGQPGKIPPSAIARIEARSGSQLSGTVEFFSLPSDRVRVVVNLTGLPPNSTHGFHIHENGDCSAPDASSAGSHWNPTNAPHAGPQAVAHHFGDLGNIVSGADGAASVTLETGDFQISGPLSVLGKAVVVHANPDDLTSQPAGNAGARIGCGVIGHHPVQ